MSEVDELKAEVARLTAALAESEAARRVTLAHDVRPFLMEDLLRRAVRNLYGRRPPARRRTAFWAEVSYHFGLGSNCSAGLARWAGFDPDTGAPITRKST